MDGGKPPFQKEKVKRKTCETMGVVTAKRCISNRLDLILKR